MILQLKKVRENMKKIFVKIWLVCISEIKANLLFFGHLYGLVFHLEYLLEFVPKVCNPTLIQGDPPFIIFRKSKKILILLVQY